MSTERKRVNVSAALGATALLMIEHGFFHTIHRLEDISYSSDHLYLQHLTSANQWLRDGKSKNVRRYQSYETKVKDLRWFVSLRESQVGTPIKLNRRNDTLLTS